ncbi:MAG TPA: nucleotidyltransferase family protein [Caulobacteraceae bacterium]
MTASPTPPDDTGLDVGRFPPAFRLACACSRWPASPERDAAVHAAAAGVDWASFLRVVARQRIPGLAYAALLAAGVELPAAAREQLATAARTTSARGLALAAESLRLARLMEAEGIEPRLIKGAAVAQLAYGSQAIKQGRDIDLLAPPADAERAFQVLRREGYVNVHPAGELTAAQRRLVFRLHKDIEFLHPVRGFSLELHWRLIDNPALLAGFGAGSAAQEVAVLNGRLKTLADPELFVYLCVHGATHAWFRLKWLADLNAWLAGKSDDEIAGFHRFARSLGVDACTGQALLLRQRLFGAAPPAALAGELRTAKLRWLVAVALDAMVGRDAETEIYQRPFGLFRLLPAQFVRGRGAAFFFGQCKLLLENLDDMLMYPLPRALHFLYPLLRLPLWLVRIVRRRAQMNRPQGAGASISS